MLISIIIPAYNVEKYLKETIESIMAQDFEDYEVIIINDGSLDGTQEIIDTYALKYPEIIRAYQQENIGQSATRNRALDYVRGKYIAFVDADDILEKDYLKIMYEACERENAEIAIVGYQKFVSETHRIIYSRNPIDWDVQFDEKTHHVFQYSPWAKLYLTKFIKEHRFVFSEGEQLEDGPYGVMTHILANRVAVVDYYGYRYRIHSDSTMGNVRKKQSKPKVPYRGIEEAILKVKEYKKDKKSNEVLEYCIIKVLTGLTTNIYKSCDKDTRKEICSYCNKIIKKYFPKVSRNPYIKIYKLRKLPIVHRIAVALFVKAYQLRLLYPFSLIVSKCI